MGEEKVLSDSESNSTEGLTNNKSKKITNNSTTKITTDDEKSNNDESNKDESNKDESNKDESNKGEPTICNEVKSNDSKDSDDNKPVDEKPQFCVAPTSTQFKLRIVPIEKLLEKKPETSKNSVDLTDGHKKLPVRTVRKNISIIELSDSESSDTLTKQIIASGSSSNKNSTVNKKRDRLVSDSSSETSDRPLIPKGSNKSHKGLKSKTLQKDDEDSRSSASSKKLPVTKGSSNAKKSKTAKSSDDSSSDSDSRLANLLAKRRKNNTSTDSRNSSEEKSLSENRPLKKVVRKENATNNRLIKRCTVRIKRVALPSTPPRAPIASEMKKLSADEKPTSSRRKAAAATESEDSDFMPANTKNNKAAKDSNSENDSQDSDVKSSDSEVMPVRRKRVFTKKKGSSGNDSNFEDELKQPAKKRRRVKKNSSDDGSDSDDDDDDDEKKNKRKHIRKIIKTKDLDISTKTAAKDEEDRRKRIEDRQKLYNQIYEKPDSVEVKELVLDFDEETQETLLEVDKGLMKKLKPHQVSGVKFMWDACFETLKDSQDNPGSGCILAHCMGLGKTMQIVTLSHTLLANSRKTSVDRVLIISPLSTLNNWAREFKQWMAFTKKKNIEIYDMSKYKDKPTRIFKLNEWYEEGGVCILGYDMYRILANEKAKGLRKKQREILQQALVEPGPDMVVCDEGHLLKNEKTSISQAVTKMRTKRRIVLTGTPLQNNLKEYYCMIQFIKPNLLGTYKEYLNRFVNPITNGQYTDSTERDIRLMKHRSHILHNLLEGCIQRRDYSVLAPYLPPKHEYVVYTTLSELQQQLYDFYINTQRDLISSDIGGKGARLFQDFQDLRRIWTHPMNLRVNSDTVIRKKLLANDSDSMEDFIDDDDDDEEESAVSSDSSADGSSNVSANGVGGKAGGKKRAGNAASTARKTRNNPNSKDSDIEDVSIVQKDDPSEWWKRFVAEQELNNLNHSPKLVILMRLLQQCEAIGDKLLVFSQSLQSLDVIEHFLSLVDSKAKGHEFEGDVGDIKGFWTPGKDYFRLDGSCSVEHREAMCKQFNDKSNLRARLFLISTRAGGLGINLVAANRVVIFDVSWNPSHDTQSIFRVYRFGQVKPCYIYRLIAMGTMEQKVYERQVAKQATAKRVIDEQQISRHYNQNDLQELYSYELKPSVAREIPNLPKDRLFAELLSEHEKLLFKYHEHDSLLENEESENLSESERKAAWSEYEAEKTRTVQTAQYISYDRNAFGNQFGNPSGSVTSNKIFGFRSDVLLQLLNMKIATDHPELSQNQVIQLVPSYLQRLYAEMNNGDPGMYKELLGLHTTLAHPSGMYMSPLLFANQNSDAAGYMQQQQQAVPAVPQMQQMAQMPRPTPNFNPDEVYEID